MKLIASDAHSTGATGLDLGSCQNVVELANDADPRTMALDGVDRIDLTFPKFTDGRAFSQAFLLRRRLGFQGEIRATGDVLIDQLVQMERTGFDVAVLREDQNLAYAQAQFDRYRGFYQGDAVTVQPAFARIGKELQVAA
ncbi:MAG: DUF934 domain-containing protein [Rhodoferax sp.]|nr:DUF934 domain-containing protein [Rhodoferax sp.]